jgi:spore coat polysaccharide biosynthesis predicted glycosyltransferase SpsG
MTRATAVEIHVDGGPRLGFGHIGRCLAIWEELDAGAAFRVTDAGAAEFLRGRRVPVIDGETGARVVVIDRAAPAGRAHVEALHAEGRRVCLVDDMGSARSVADAVVDPPTASHWPPAAGRRLAGFEHVLLRSDVRAAVPLERARSRVLLGIGGSDPAGLTPVLAEALEGAGIDTIAALGPGYRGRRPDGAVLGSPAEWGPALAAASAAVTGFGHSLLEAAHLGVPAVAAVFMKDHLEDARNFARHGFAEFVDMTEGPEPEELVRRLRDILETPRGAEMGRRGADLVDGRGAARVARAIAELAA